MFSWFKGKHIDFAVNETQILRVCGVKFSIRKLNPLDYMNGSKVLMKEFETYRSTKEQASSLDENKLTKLKEHYADVFMSAVVSPELTRKENEPYKTYVGSLFKNWDLCVGLYEGIMIYTYGKKKVKSILSQSKTL